MKKLLLLLFLIPNLVIGETSKTNALPTEAEVYQENKTWKYKAWSLDVYENGDLLRASTSGDVVHGHTFGIIKEKNNCNDNALSLFFSSNKKGVDKLKGKKIPIEIKVDEKIYKFNLALNTIEKLPIRRVQDIGKNDAPTISLLAFENIPLDELFISDLKKGNILNLKISEENDFTKEFDITNENFSLNGFVANYTKLTESCKDINQLLIPPAKIKSDSKNIKQYSIDNLVSDHSRCNNNDIRELFNKFPSRIFTFYNNYLYWGFDNDGQDKYENIYVLNICDPLNPLPVTEINGTASQFFYMYTDGKYLYVDSFAYDDELDQKDSSFKIIDTKEFKLVSKIEQESVINPFAIYGDKIYLTEQKYKEPKWVNTIKIYNISNKKTPILEDKFTPIYEKFFISGIEVDEKYIYLTGNSHLKIYDKKTFKLLSNTEFENRTDEIIINNDEAIMTGWDKGGAESFISYLHLNDRKKIDVLKKIKIQENHLRKINQNTFVFGTPPNVNFFNVGNIKKIIQ